MIATTLNATVWRVNNRPYLDADYTTLQDAIDGAADGDTLYIGGSTSNYGNGTFDKQLVVIGAGYWLDENDTTQSYTENSQVGKLIFNTGSEGSVIEGLYIYFASSNGFQTIRINVDDINILKNKIHASAHSYTNASSVSIYVSDNRTNIKINQNWIYSYSYGSSANATSIYFSGIPTNCSVSNNFIRATSSYGSYYAINMGTNNLINDLIINNNVIWGPITTYHTFLVNNILISGSYNNSVDDQTSNNLCDGTQFPDINNNQQNVDMSTVFIDYVGYIDNDYILKSGSPAIGAGVNGGDCGVFSYDYGSDAYVLSGMPGVPSIFDADVQSTVGATSLPVNIKATSHN